MQVVDASSSGGRWGPGKVHVAEDHVSGFTLCNPKNGVYGLNREGKMDEVTCKKCLKAIRNQ